MDAGSVGEQAVAIMRYALRRGVMLHLAICCQLTLSGIAEECLSGGLFGKLVL